MSRKEKIVFKNYLKIAFRNIIRHKIYSFINITGLAIGLACFLLIFLWVQDELSWDRFHENANHIYRVVFEYEKNGQQRNHWRTPPPLASGLKAEFPEIIRATKFHSHADMLVAKDETKLKKTGGFTDSSIFDIFTLPLIKGNSKSIFDDPNSIVISEKMASQLFGQSDPINQSLKIDNQFDFTVAGVIRNLPKNSSLQFDFLIPFENLEKIAGYGNLEDWGDWGFSTFLLLPPKADVKGFNAKLSGYFEKIEIDFARKLYLQPLPHIHLYGLQGNGVIRFVYIFSSIALFILLIACINFMNLSTARSIKRSKEVGLRKVIGANKRDLIQQFYGESIILTIISLCCAIVIVELLLPLFNELSGKTLSLGLMSNPYMFLMLLSVAFFTGLISGSYPAVFLSSFKPIEILKGTLKSESISLRKSLVVFQFIVSIVLIICTIVVSKQVKHLSEKDLGFDKNNVVYVPLNKDLSEKYDAVIEELKRNPEVLEVSSTSSRIGVGPKWSISSFAWEGSNGEREINMAMISVDYGFLDVFALEMAEGRFYFSSDYENYVLNEAAIAQMGLDSPIGKEIDLFDNKGKIIGVVKDFNFRSLHSRIEPLMLVIIPSWDTELAIRIASTNIPATLKHIENVTRSISPDFPFEYHFLDEDFEALYRSEQQMGTIFNYFSILGIFISCLGLLGLASCTAERRTKEIGIRKVLGASASNIVWMLSQEFIKWVLIANLIAWPIAYFAMNKWLENFAYKVNLSLWMFLISGSVALTIALVTVSFQSIKAAISNPIDALKYE